MEGGGESNDQVVETHIYPTPTTSSTPPPPAPAPMQHNMQPPMHRLMHGMARPSGNTPIRPPPNQYASATHYTAAGRYTLLVTSCLYYVENNTATLVKYCI